MQLWRYWGKRKALHVHKDYKVVRCSQCDAWFWMLSLTLPIISTIPLLTFHLAVFCDYLWPPLSTIFQKCNINQAEVFSDIFFNLICPVE